MIRKQTSNSSSSSHDSNEEDGSQISSSFSESKQDVIEEKGQYGSFLQQNHIISMEKLNENQINEGVVYLPSGVGLPNPYYTCNKGGSQINGGLTVSLATTSASMLSNLQLLDSRHKI